jgi:hypothetical protein
MAALSIEHWEQWRRALEKAFLSRTTTRSLKEQLLRWKDGVPTHWKWHFCPAEDRLHAKEGLLWRVYSRHLGRTSPRKENLNIARPNSYRRSRPKKSI